jgi:hypothetical protein
MFGKGYHIVCGGRAFIHDKVGVHRGNLSASNRKSFKAALLDQPPCRRLRRVAEHTACRLVGVGLRLGAVINELKLFFYAPRLRASAETLQRRSLLFSHGTTCGGSSTEGRF